MVTRPEASKGAWGSAIKTYNLCTISSSSIYRSFLRIIFSLVDYKVSQGRGFGKKGEKKNIFSTFPPKLFSPQQGMAEWALHSALTVRHDR
jgi:hypothetical protein